MIVWTFGDSWGAGWGLDPAERTLGKVVADNFLAEFKNRSESGSSLGQIVFDFQRALKYIDKDDMVVIIVPPDIRWYTEMKDKNGIFFKSLYLGMKEYNKFIGNKSIFWFQYHHSLFLYTLYKLCKDKGCKFLFAHNYGQLSILDSFGNNIPDSVWLNRQKSLTELLGAKDWKQNYNKDLFHDGPPNIEGKYFIPGDTHPNAEGHEKIGELLTGRFNELYK